MPAAARTSDMHTCPAVEPGPKPHVGGPVTSGHSRVIIGGQRAACQGDSLACAGATDRIAGGDATVLFGDKPAARLGDPTEHGGVIVAGCPTVQIGCSAQGATLITDRPFCEECMKARK